MQSYRFRRVMRCELSGCPKYYDKIRSLEETREVKEKLNHN